MHKIINASKTVLLALALSFGLSYVYAWTAPTITAPNGNVSAPINTSSTAQAKAGNFTAPNLIDTSATLQQKSGDLTVKNFVADMVNVGLPLNANAITAPKFCLGSSCVTAWSTGTVTSLSSGTGITLSPNPITTTGTITNSGVTGLTAGAGITLSPAGPGATGAVTVSTSVGTGMSGILSPLKGKTISCSSVTSGSGGTHYAKVDANGYPYSETTAVYAPSGATCNSGWIAGYSSSCKIGLWTITTTWDFGASPNVLGSGSLPSGTLNCTGNWPLN